MDPDGGWHVMAGTGGRGGLLDAEAVVPQAFQRPRAAAMAVRRGQLAGDPGLDPRQCGVPVIRGRSAVPVAIRRTMPRTRVKLIRSGSMSAASAARVAATGPPLRRVPELGSAMDQAGITPGSGRVRAAVGPVRRLVPGAGREDRPYGVGPLGPADPDSPRTPAAGTDASGKAYVLMATSEMPRVAWVPR